MTKSNTIGVVALGAALLGAVSANAQVADPFIALSSVPAMENVLVNIAMNSLHDRMGDLRRDKECEAQGLWVRAYGDRVKIDDSTKTTANVAGIEAGIDTRIVDTVNNRLLVGIMAGYINAFSSKTKAEGEKLAKGDLGGGSLGLYATWLHAQGWYVDAAVRSFWLRGDMKNETGAGMVKYKPERQVFAVSVEAGKEFKIDSFQLEPSVRVTYANGAAEQYRPSAAFIIDYDSMQSLRTRAGALVRYAKNEAFKPFIDVGVFNEFKGEDTVAFTGVGYESDLKGFGWDVGIGFDSILSESWSMYAKVGYEDGKNHEVIGANVGARMTF